MDIFGNSENLSTQKRKAKLDEDELNFTYNKEGESQEETRESQRKHLVYLKIFSLIVFLIIASKLFISQIINAKYSESLAMGNKIRPRVVRASRGMIYDNKGEWLARNIPSFNLAIYPANLPKRRADREKVYEKIAIISGIGKEEVLKKSEENGLLSLDEVVLKENLSQDEALLLEEKVADIPGLFVGKRSSREYKEAPGLSFILGYNGKVSKDDLATHPTYLYSDWIGKTGLELSYESQLKGQDGVEQIEIDSKGNIDRVLIDPSNKEPISGNNLTLFLDLDLQNKISEYLNTGFLEAQKLTGDTEIGSGVVIAMNPKNGAILSIVSTPSYNNNIFVKGIATADYKALADDPKKPLFNRALSGQYPPGSTIKPMMAVAGLSEGSLNANTSFDTPAEISIGEWKFPDWKDHGQTNIETAIAESNNIFFYAIGGGFDKIRGLGIENINKWWKNFGYGRESGIDLPSESNGLLPTPEWKEKVKKEPWYIGDTYHVSIGQGDLLVTPIQMAKMVSTIANGGKLLKPQLVSKITDKDGKIILENGPKVESEQVADPAVISIVQQGMRRAAMPGGSAYSVFGSDFIVPVAGKTGTAQFFDNQKTHAWFECYAPYDDPQIVLLVMVEGGGGGYEVAAPIAKNILQYYFSR